jgi:hypothetical protein
MKRSPAAFIALLVVIALIGWGIFRQSHRAPAPAAPPPTAAELADPGSDVVSKAMRGTEAGPAPGGAPIDSAAYKSRWLDEVRGADLTGLDEPRKELFLRFANAERCTCGCGYTLAGCKASDMTCEVSGGLIEALLDSIRTGKIRSAAGVRARPRPHAS